MSGDSAGGSDDSTGNPGDATGKRSTSTGEPGSSVVSNREQSGAFTRAFAGARAWPDAPFSRADAPWVGGVLAVGLAVAATYVLTNPYPAFGAGLYTVIADGIRASGYGLPAGVSGYTTEPVPVAYPPLGFYVLAVLRDLGVGTFAAARFLPPLVTAAALVPAYLLGRDLLDGRAQGCAAALLLGVNPQVLQWHISAGGVVRAPAFLFALSSSYAALRLFRDRDSTWLPAAVVLFALTVLTHPTYTLFAVLTAVLFWIGFDRTLSGLLRGTAMGLGGAAVTAPWWVTVATIHGPTVFAAAAGTHGGVGGGLFSGVSIWTFVPLTAAVILALAGRRVLPAWVVVAEIAFAQPRFVYTVGSFAVVGVAVELARRFPRIVPDRPGARRVLVAAILVTGAIAGVGQLGYSFASTTDRTTPAFVDDDDVAAMEWAAAETEPDSTFVVLGDAAEWFPAVADRTILVAPWGSEWRTPETYARHLGAFKNASACGTAGCLDASLAPVDPDPDYLYVPRGGYTVRGFRYVQFGTLERSLELTGRYERVYANDGVVIYRVRDDDA
ncbi:glycosyltransferase family 39 protein [Halorarum halophilum]|uniref:Glycosyltransferase family 39 protein n=1 Tax=Halorarum halophilum TaxID=2743090 RepID=A0A7D5L2Z7_9EURY|nr:glycosyltransferase family 39 protein [Halobaculum halophilum]QLG29263.1 glycosyltransferase family 39 protein [Halobaculum halophilum]